jgi:Ni/Co efflux regulator RcnB
VGPTAQRPPNLARPGDWNRTLRGADRDRAGQQWRQRNEAWQDRAPWRRDPNWWRQDRAFHLFLGPRLGFFFIPDLGYVSVPSQYESRRWIEGQYLPSWFWRYVVRDYWNYGLPDPPLGCIWVWVGNDVALIDQRDGYILEIVHNVW